MRERSWAEYFASLFIAAVLALFVRSFVLTAYKVPTGSMQPTLKPGDFIFATRFDYGLKTPWAKDDKAAKPPSRGDVVVFSYPSQPSVIYVKRVVGLPGDVIEIKSGELSINGRAFNYTDVSEERRDDNPNPEFFKVFEESAENHKSHFIVREKAKTSPSFGPLTVPQGEVFLLGDNRDASDDSRYWGAVPNAYIFGKVRWIWLSLDSQKKWAGDRISSVRWFRVFSTVN